MRLSRLVLIPTLVLMLPAPPVAQEFGFRAVMRSAPLRLIVTPSGSDQ